MQVVLILLYWPLFMSLGALIAIQLYRRGARSRWWLWPSFFVPVGTGLAIVRILFAPASKIGVALSLSRVKGHLADSVLGIVSMSCAGAVVALIFRKYIRDVPWQTKVSGKPQPAE
jgi:hypothetical protein